jgi:hypothetical protein
MRDVMNHGFLRVVIWLVLWQHPGVSPTAPVARHGKPSVALVPDTSFDASIGRGPSSVLDQDSTRESSPHRPTVASPKSTERPVRRQRGSKQAHSPVHTGNSLDIVMSQLDDEPHLPSPPRNTTVIGFLSDSMKIPSPMRAWRVVSLVNSVLSTW